MTANKSEIRGNVYWIAHQCGVPSRLGPLLRQRRFRFSEVSVADAIRFDQTPAVVFAPPGLDCEVEERAGNSAISVVCVKGSFNVERDIVLAASGKLVIPTELEPSVLCEVVENLIKRLDPASSLVSRYRLSHQEARLLRCMMQGLNSYEAAERMGCKVQTLPTYWTRIFKKTGVGTQRELLLLLIRRSEPELSLGEAVAS